MAEKDSNFFKTYIGKQDIVLQHNMEQRDKILNKYLEKQIDTFEKAEKAEKACINRINAYKQAGLLKEAADEEANINLLRESRIAAEKELNAEKLRMSKHANDIARTYEINQYKGMTAQKRREYSKQVVDNIKEELTASKVRKTSLEQENKDLEKIIKSRSKKISKEDKERAREQLKINTQTIQQIDKSQTELLRKQSIAEKAATSFKKRELIFDSDARKEKIQSKVSIAKEKLEDKQLATALAKAKLDEQQIKHAIKEEEIQKRINKAKASGNAAELEAAEKERIANQQELDAAEEKLRLAEEEEKKAQGHLNDEQNKANLLNALNTLAEKLTDATAIDKAIDDIQKGRAKYTARLSGSGDTWGNIVDDVTNSVGFAGIVTSRSVIENMRKLVDEGVAYNVELRSFLAATSENIASTFNATDGTLLRLIRLQQADTTAARLGLEATLVELFNELFKDTSYLKTASDNITNAIFESSAMLDKNASLEYEYTLQKWLGSLYSLGMSSEAVSAIATGINYLGTGNVSALSGNSSLTTLLAMSAARAGGKSYAEMLTSGINADDTNSLLRAMVEYLAEIAESQENYVTKSAYADLFGMSIADLTTFTSLTKSEIDQLYKSSVSYEDLNKKTESKLSQIVKNMSLTEMLDNVLDNALVGTASSLSENAGVYGLWKALGFLKSTVGEIKIPSIMAVGSGIGDLDLLNVAQTAMAGLGLVGSLVGALGSVTRGGVDSLSAWDYQEYTPRGSTLSLLTTGTSQSTSFSAQLGAINASSEDIEAITLEQGEKRGLDELEKIQSEELEEVANMEKKIYEAVADDSGNTVLKTLMQMCGSMESTLPSEGTSSESITSPESLSGGSTGSGSNSSDDSSEIYNKIYEAISAGESVNVLTVLQEINDKLNQDRVFYTAMATTSSSSGTVGAITDISAHIQGNKIPVVSDEQSGVTSTDPSTNKPSGVSGLGGGLFNSETAAEDLELIISTAVETALRTVAGYSNGNGLPVVVTNLNNYGG